MPRTPSGVFFIAGAQKARAAPATRDSAQSIGESEHPDRNRNQRKLDDDISHQQRRRPPVRDEANQTARHEAAPKKHRGQNSRVSVSVVECGV